MPTNGGVRKWISDRGNTIRDAVGARRYGIDGAAAVGLAVAEWLASHWKGWPLSTTPSWFIWGTIALGLISFWLLSYATQQRLEKLPKLKVGFDRKDHTCFHETYVDGNPEAKVIYVAVLPRALSPTPVKSCVGWLNSISELGDDGQWHRTPFVSRRKLEWGTMGFQPVDIDNVTDQALNVFRVLKSNPAFFLPSMRGSTRMKKSFRYEIRRSAGSTLSLSAKVLRAQYHSKSNWLTIGTMFGWSKYHPSTSPSASLSVRAWAAPPS